MLKKVLKMHEKICGRLVMDSTGQVPQFGILTFQMYRNLLHCLQDPEAPDVCEQTALDIPTFV